MSENKSACGPHVEVVRTEGVRVARCPCGTIHVTLQRSGVTVQLAAEHFAEVVQALSLAKTLVEPREESHSRAVVTPVSGRFVSIEAPGAKKPSN
jgi:hypothetical protein